MQMPSVLGKGFLQLRQEVFLKQRRSKSFARILDISTEDIIAFGDEVNDMEILKLVGLESQWKMQMML